jgi:hypothetical protein
MAAVAIPFSQMLCPASSREEQLFLKEKLRQVSPERLHIL